VKKLANFAARLGKKIKFVVFLVVRIKLLN
jgi:hypothetical protein